MAAAEQLRTLAESTAHIEEVEFNHIRVEELEDDFLIISDAPKWGNEMIGPATIPTAGAGPDGDPSDSDGSADSDSDSIPSLQSVSDSSSDEECEPEDVPSDTDLMPSLQTVSDSDVSDEAMSNHGNSDSEDSPYDAGSSPVLLTAANSNSGSDLWFNTQPDHYADSYTSEHSLDGYDGDLEDDYQEGLAEDTPDLQSGLLSLDDEYDSRSDVSESISEWLQHVCQSDEFCEGDPDPPSLEEAPARDDCQSGSRSFSLQLPQRSRDGRERAIVPDIHAQHAMALLNQYCPYMPEEGPNDGHITAIGGEASTSIMYRDLVSCSDILPTEDGMISIENLWLQQPGFNIVLWF
ncbi:hypothetical protein V8D89_008444 [Ganoderma adspersum]